MEELACKSERIIVGTDWVYDGLASFIPRKTTFVGIVTDVTVYPLITRSLEQHLREQLPHCAISTFVLPDGEPSKSREQKELIEGWLFEQRAVKSSVLVAVGGGVVGDLTGFVAATFMRGIPVIQVPTSLLAMVDSAVGGKTAIDVPEGKNLIGAFHHPLAVCIDVAFLRTLPLRHLSNGMAEVIKMAAALDAAFFGWLENTRTAELVLERDAAALLKCVKVAAQLKATIIDEDERDGARRNILNVGHTVGHALEAVLAPQWLHGECVSVGMVVEAFAALRSGVLSSVATVERIKRVLKLFKLPVVLPFGQFNVDSVVEFAMRDKKSETASDLRCVFLSGIGSVGAAITYGVSEPEVRMLLSPAVQVVPITVSSSSAKTVELDVPGSKSVSNRVLLLAALGTGTTTLSGLLHADDTYVTLDALSALGVSWQWNSTGSELCVIGSGGSLRCDPGCEIYLGNAGTASRFLTAACSWLPVGQSVVLRGSARLHERPIKPLVDSLIACGVSIDYLGADGCFPIRVHGANGLPEGIDIRLDSSLSSQFTSAVLMAAARGGGSLTLTGEIVSQPYVRMTMEIMGVFGCLVKSSDDAHYAIPMCRSYQNPPRLAVEADASSSTYPLAIAAVTGTSVTVTNIGSRSLQGDAAFASLLERMGCFVEQREFTTHLRGPAGGLRAIEELNMADQTDAFMTLAAVAAVAKGTTRIVGIANQRVKECDRIAAMIAGLRACGVDATELADGIQVVGSGSVGALYATREVAPKARIECFKDHRIAMSFAVLGCVVPGIVLLDKSCVEKTFPHFWQRIQCDFGAGVAGADAPSPDHPKQLQKVESGPATVVLIGMRGAGKTFFGRELAKRLEKHFVDADEAFGTPGPRDFVAEHGMEAFRVREASVLAKIFADHPHDAVVACGGGIVETQAGRECISAASRAGMLVVHVRRAWNVLEKFLEADSERVPLKEPLVQTWLRRLPYFENLSKLEYYHSDAGIQERQHDAFSALIKRALQWNFLPPIRLGPGTNFVCLTLSTYRTDSDGSLKRLVTELRSVDALELRVDLLASLELDSVLEELAAVRSHFPGIPIVFTVRSRCEGGKWDETLGPQRYFELLNVGARAGCEFIDVEARWSGPLFDSFRLPFPNFQVLVISEHSMGDGAPRAALAHFQSMALRCRMAAGTSRPERIIVKIVGQAREPDDCALMKAFLSSSCFLHILPASSLGFIGMLAGPAGRLSRLQAPLLTPCTHSALALPAAPGQLTSDELHELRLRVGLVKQSRIVLFGKPISKSPSPAMHNAGFAALGVDSYLRYEACETDSLEVVRATVTSDNFVGANVTIPLKESVLGLCDILSASAKSIGSVNVLWRDRGTGKLVGDNTDWQAIFFLCKHYGSNADVVVVGAGGTARAACYALKRMGARRVVIINRTLDRARTLGNIYGFRAVASAEELTEFVPNLIIGTVPGSSGYTVPNAWVGKSSVRCVLDASYIPRQTALLGQFASSPDVICIQGWRMLLEQGVRAFSAWMGGQNARGAIEEALLKVMDSNEH